MSAKDLESSLREGGEKVSEGRIRIDSARALQRLRDFRFAEPSHWVLEVLRAATLSHAKNLTIRTDADDVEISFDGRAFPADLMRHLPEQALNGGQSADEKRTRLLSLGVAGALGVGARFVKVQSGGVTLSLENDRVQVTEERTTGTHLHLRKAFGWRVTAAFFRGSPEARAITERAQRLPPRLTLNGTVIPAPSPASLAKKGAQGEGWRLEAWLPPGAPLPVSTLELDVGGVVVAERQKPLPGLQLRAWLRADDLRRNASGSDVVDDDVILDQALVALRKISRELLEQHGKQLAKDPAWRTAFLDTLLAQETLDPQVKKLLFDVPLLPSPGDEWLSLDELTKAAKSNGCVYTSKSTWPRGSFPPATVMVVGEPPFARLLPPGKRVDVEAVVKQKRVIAENRQRHEQTATESPTLPARAWVARAKIDATALIGEVGFESSGNGAFVRILHKGRLMESGELTALAPLRLRAVIDWNRPLADSYFAAEGGTRLLGLVLKYVENAATRAICEALPNPEVLPHAFDLLTRLVTLRSAPLEELPPALRGAPLFPTQTGLQLSLNQLEAAPRWSFVTTHVSRGPLDGSLLLVLSPPQVQVLKKLAHQKLEDLTTQLRNEAEVRRRMEGPKTAAEVSNTVVKVAVEGEGLRGEVGIPKLPSTKLALTLIKSGLALESTELSARYHHAVAAVDCERLSPNPRWTAATRDGAFKAVSAAVHDAQRRLALELVKLPREKWFIGAELFFIAYLKKELTPLDRARLDEVNTTIAQTPLFSGARGPLSLMQLKDRVKQEGRFFVVSSNRPQVPPDFEVLLEPASLAEALGEALGRAPEDPTAVLSALEARRRLQALPAAEFKLPSGLALECRVTGPNFTALAGLRDGVEDQASGHVHLEGRVYSALLIPCALPLSVVIDAPGFEPNAFRELTGDQRLELGKMVAAAMHEVLRVALQRPEDDANARRVLLLALRHNLELSVPAIEGEALRDRALFPCTDGHVRSVKELDAQSPQFITSLMQGELPNGRPIVVAADPLVRLAMRRWPRAQPVEDELHAQLSAIKQRAHVAKVTEVVSKVASPWRQRVSERDFTGEVVVADGGAGRLEVFIDKKPLCVLEGVLPAPLAGAIDSPRLTPMPGFAGVVQDERLEEALDALKGSAERLAAQLATAPRVPGMDSVLVQLAFWVASSLAWQWKKKKKGKKKQDEVVTRHPLLSAALLRATDGSAISLQSLITAHREGRVDVATQGGPFLDRSRKAWWPRPGEDRWAEPLGFTLNDVTAELRLADSIRARPRFAKVASPLASAWREPVHGPSIEGELAIGEAPDGKLVIEVLHERMVLETWSSEHPVGGLARVDSSALNPNELWTGVKRDAAFKALVTSTEAALERLLVRRLADPQSRGFRAWAIAAVHWRSGQAGPLSGLVPGLPLFSDLRGEPMTIGAVLELATRKGRVPIAQASVKQDVSDVVLDGRDTRELLLMLGLESEDVTGELKRAKDLQQTLTERRLASLTWKGEAVVKVTVATAMLSGELALRRGGLEDGVMLARDGIAVAPLEDSWPGVVGVIDVKDLVVNDDWTAAEPTRAQRSAIRAEVERLYAEVTATSLGDGDREIALAWVLRFLLDNVVATAGQLDRLKHVAQVLADAPLFLTVEGERVSLRSVAAEVNAREKVAVLRRDAGVPKGVVSCVLAASSFTAPWLSALEEFFGKTKVWRVTDLEEWQRSVREADPLEGSAELQGLSFLRREVRLLRAGALGRLTPDDLEDVKLSRAGGAVAMRYDRKRKLALLDPDHPGVARTLKEAAQRPERIWVLIAALFGLVNRELEHVTDAHEAQLLIALAGHLATNPKLLA
ncbi:MAG: hypothetical protein Q8K32_21385 [Archangium sp.]|nr:hypothetical protein [Archangium sp.]